MATGPKHHYCPLVTLLSHCYPLHRWGSPGSKQRESVSPPAKSQTTKSILWCRLFRGESAAGQRVRNLFAPSVTQTADVGRKQRLLAAVPDSARACVRLRAGFLLIFEISDLGVIIILTVIISVLRFSVSRSYFLTRIVSVSAEAVRRSVSQQSRVGAC